MHLEFGVVFFLLIALAFIVWGIRLLIYAIKFRKTSLEAQAYVIDSDEKIYMESTKRGYRKSGTLYCVNLEFNVSDLPCSTARVFVSKRKYSRIEQGSIVTIYYLPNDVRHIALARGQWFDEAVAVLLFALVWLAVAFGMSFMLFI